MTHYCIHHVRTPQNAYLKKFWKHRVDHHYRDNNKGYGVSSALRDHVFGSMQELRNTRK